MMEEILKNSKKYILIYNSFIFIKIYLRFQKSRLYRRI